MRGPRAFSSQAQIARLRELERSGAVERGTVDRMLARTQAPARLPKTALPAPTRQRLSNRMPPRPSVTRAARKGRP